MPSKLSKSASLCPYGASCTHRENFSELKGQYFLLGENEAFLDWTTRFLPEQLHPVFHCHLIKGKTEIYLIHYPFYSIC